MKIKCRGYSGELVSLDATEAAVSTVSVDILYDIEWYDIEIRTEDGAKISLSRVKKNEIEAVILE